MSIDLSPMTAVSPAARTTFRRWRGPVILVAVVVLASVLLALAQGQRNRGYLDPEAVDPRGAGALASLLREQGVDVVRVTSATEARDAVYDAGRSVTLLVAAELAPISARMADAATFQPATHMVVLGGDPQSVANLAPRVDQTGFSDLADEIAPDCDLPLAQRVGPLVAQGTQYSARGAGVTTCWDAWFLEFGTDNGDQATTVLGSGELFTNDVLADSGNAALGLNLLGRDRTVVWWLPSIADPLLLDEGSGGASVADLVPSWVPLAAWQLLAVALWAVWWRGRRLGRVVVEPLPVTVRATEAVEGRARLYRRAGARGRAADVMRAASAARISALLRLPRTAGLDEVVPAVAARTGRDTASVAALLTPGNDPADDASLSRLADALDTLEDEVRRS
ncbi:MAG: DUF4350 domain-containing protein [Candidatus Nanopelagicales bacterium]